MKGNKVLTFLIGLTAWVTAVLVAGGDFRAAETGEPMMYLTVKDYEAGVSLPRLAAPRSHWNCRESLFYADTMRPTIDWNDGNGPHKPDTNYVTTMFQKTTPVIQSGVYLFWEDSHVAPAPGTSTVTTKLVVHCLGDPPGDKVYETKNTIHSYARVPVQKVEFQQNGAPVTKVRGHDLVDVEVTLAGASPESGTWVKLTTSPQAALNSLPPFYFIAPGETVATIQRLETRKPSANTNLVTTASTYGKPQETQTLVVTP